MIYLWNKSRRQIAISQKAHQEVERYKVIGSVPLVDQLSTLTPAPGRHLYYFLRIAAFIGGRGL